MPEITTVDYIRVPVDDITIVWGHGSREKTVEITGIETSLVQRRLTAAAAGKNGRP